MGGGEGGRDSGEKEGMDTTGSDAVAAAAAAGPSNRFGGTLPSCYTLLDDLSVQSYRDMVMASFARDEAMHASVEALETLSEYLWTQRSHVWPPQLTAFKDAEVSGEAGREDRGSDLPLAVLELLRGPPTAAAAAAAAAAVATAAAAAVPSLSTSSTSSSSSASSASSASAAMARYVPDSAVHWGAAVSLQYEAGNGDARDGREGEAGGAVMGSMMGSMMGGPVSVGRGDGVAGAGSGTGMGSSALGGIASCVDRRCPVCSLLLMPRPRAPAGKAGRAGKTGRGGKAAGGGQGSAEAVTRDVRLTMAVTVFPCGHAFHEACVPEMSCLECLSVNWTSLLC